MVNKRGYLRILEALIAIVILFGAVLFINSNVPKVDVSVPSNVHESQGIILEKFSFNGTLRGCVLDVGFEGLCSDNLRDLGGSTCADAFDSVITDDLPIGYSYLCEICSQSLSCIGTSAPINKSVFTSTVFLSDDETNKKVVRLYFWR